MREAEARAREAEARAREAEAAAQEPRGRRHPDYWWGWAGRLRPAATGSTAGSTRAPARPRRRMRPSRRRPRHPTAHRARVAVSPRRPRKPAADAAPASLGGAVDPSTPRQRLTFA